jgi:YegS/Rv2252/BmrU family lipid kinase
MRRKIGFIVNPYSGTDRKKSLEQLIGKYLPPTQYDYEIAFTEFKGHGIGLAKQFATDNYESVVAVGGDGTANEVAQGLIHTNTALGLIPKGSGNGLARNSHIPLQPSQALSIIAKGYIKSVDIGRINGQLFLSNAGVGLDAHIALLCKSSDQRGLMMYIKNTVAGFRTYKPRSYELIIDGKEIKRKAIMISVANGNEFGYGFKIAPTAKNNDGLLDVMVIHPLNLWNAGRVSFHAWWGNLHKYSKVTHYRAKQISIVSDQIDSYQIDGDGYIHNSSDIQFGIEHKVLNLIVP